MKSEKTQNRGPKRYRFDFTTRVWLLDPDNRLLLFRSCNPEIVNLDLDNPVDRVSVFWATLGGGLLESESFEEAALREVFEETGLTGISIGPLVFHRTKRGVMEGVALTFIERYFVARTQRFEVSVDGLHGIEQRTYAGHRWWTLTEIESTREVIFPDELPDLFRYVVEQVSISDQPLS